MSTLIKYGTASDLTFGTSDLSSDWGFDIVEAMSAEETFGTEINVKDHNGDTVGLVLGDKKTTGSVSGMAASLNYGVGDTATNPTSVGESSIVITSLRANYANEDFLKYEIGFSAWEGVDVTDSST